MCVGYLPQASDQVPAAAATVQSNTCSSESLYDVDCSEDENDYHTPLENEYHLQDSDQCQI